MGFFGDLINTAIDIVTIPLDVVEDVLNGDVTLENTREKIEDIAQGGADIVKDVVNLDL